MQGVIKGGGEWLTEALKQRGTKNHRDTQRQRDKVHAQRKEVKDQKDSHRADTQTGDRVLYLYL